MQSQAKVQPLRDNYAPYNPPEFWFETQPEFIAQRELMRKRDARAIRWIAFGLFVFWGCFFVWAAKCL